MRLSAKCITEIQLKGLLNEYLSDALPTSKEDSSVSVLCPPNPCTDVKPGLFTKPICLYVYLCVRLS